MDVLAMSYGTAKVAKFGGMHNLGDTGVFFWLML